MTGNYKSEFAIPTCFSTGCLSFKGIFDLICFYVVLYLVNSKNYQIRTPEEGESTDKSYYVELSKDVFNDLCPRFANKGSSYTRLHNALKNATLSIKDDDNCVCTVPIFTFRDYSNATLRLEFNSIFNHIFEKMGKHLKSDKKNDDNNGNDQIQYTGFTLFDITELCTIKTFYQARTFEFLHAKAYNRSLDYAPGSKVKKINTLDYYFALGKLTNRINSSNIVTTEKSECRLSESEVTTLWKHVNEEIFNGEPLKVSDSELIEAEKTEKDRITFTIMDLRPERAKKNTKNPPNNKSKDNPAEKKQKGSYRTYPSDKKKNEFHNFQERDYDYNELMKIALEASMQGGNNSE